MITVIIPSYKNHLELLKNLTHNLKFIAKYQIIIVNDSPEKSLKKELEKLPQVTLIENKKNIGFGPSINIAVQKAKSDYILLLNSDVVLEDSSFEKAFAEFKKDPEIFSVSFAQKETDGKITGKNTIYWQRGLFFHKKAKDLSFGINAWAEGGAALFDRQKFLRLNGFDPLYSPFYWEDIDLSYRAWKSGYKILFDPKILVRHNHGTTINKYFSATTVKKIAYRNQLIFIWKNIVDFGLVINHLFFLPYNLIYYSHKKEGFFSGFIQALKLLPEVFAKKDNHSRLKDQQILAMFK